MNYGRKQLNTLPLIVDQEFLPDKLSIHLHETETNQDNEW